jgi:membrane fusion protein (multidrug efflux system)
VNDPLRLDRVAALGTMILAVFAFPGCGRREAATGREATKPVDVTAITVAAQDVPVAYEFVAQTQSSRQVNIQARVSGFLERRVYTEGSIVKEGQVLFLMDAKPFQTQVDAQKAALAKQQAGLEVARADLERTKPLAAQEALSQKDLDDATGQYLAAAAAVEEAKARLETAQLNLSYCTIASPVAGITGAAMQQDGSYISPLNSLLTTVAALSPMWVNFSVSENEMASYREQIAKGRLRRPPNGDFTVDVLLVDGSLFPHSGRITFAAPAFSAETGTFLLRASINNPEGILRPNAYVRVRLKGAVRPQAIVVPQRAVQQGSQGQFVWIVDKGGNAQPRPVEVGPWHESDWFIDEGLHAGDQVIVDGTLALHPGVPVAVKPAAAASTGAADSKAGG